jgi:hypothetical protein
MADYLINANSVGGGRRKSGADRRLARVCLSSDVTCPKFASHRGHAHHYSTDVYTVVPRKNFHSSTNVNRGNSSVIRFSNAESCLLSINFVFPNCASFTAGIGRTMKLHTKMWESLTECVQFRTDCYVGLPFGKEKNKCRNDFSASTHFINARLTK